MPCGRSEPGSLSAVITNLAIDHLKRARREVALDPARPELPAPSAKLQPGLREAVERAFLLLPPKIRAVANLALIEERSFAEIAEALHIALGTVNSREYRAVHLLRKQLVSQGIQP